MDFYYFSLCHTCKQPSPNLKKCGGCKVLHYCSKDHQVSDWSNHKELCRIIVKTKKIWLAPTRLEAEQFNLFKYSSGVMWGNLLGRHLLYYEHQMWMFPKVCQICYSEEVTIICQTCLSVAYCSEEHQESHQETHGKSCQTLKLCLSLYQNLNAHQPRGWLKLKFGEINREIQRLPGNIEEAMTLLGFNFQPAFSKELTYSVSISDLLGPIFNMILALEKSSFLINRHGRKSNLLIYLVGLDVDDYKICTEKVLQVLSHWIVNLKSAKLVLVGPEVRNRQTTKVSCDCDRCKAKKFIGVVLERRHLELGAFDKERPDLVVAFTSDILPFFHTEENTHWKKTVAKLIRFRGIPALLTAFTESDLQKDVALFADARIVFLVKPQKNPYANLKPIRNFEDGKYEPVLYHNSYIAIIYSEEMA